MCRSGFNHHSDARAPVITRSCQQTIALSFGACLSCPAVARLRPIPPNTLSVLALYCRQRSANQASNVLWKCASLRQLPRLKITGDASQSPQQTTKLGWTCGGDPSACACHSSPTVKLVSMCTMPPTSSALKCSLFWEKPASWAVPPDSTRSVIAVAVAKHVQLPQHTTSAQAIRQAQQLLLKSDLPRCQFVLYPTSLLGTVGAVLPAAGCEATLKRCHVA